ncbi:TRAP transporter small permease subunit [Granulosicoccaceae sp. 1_MG-2023]|nr:TRAP transporter small permease subunit [Granulosicoccaceae sp. 1_MG-2023]
MEAIIRLFDRLAFVALLGMLSVVVAGVLTRLLFDLSDGRLNLLFPGSVEIAGYALLIMVFASLPRAAVNGLIRVQVLVSALPAAIRATLTRLWNLALALFAALLSWLFSGRVREMIERGDRTQDLGIPLYLFYAALSVCCIATMATCLWLTFRRRTGPCALRQTGS